MSSWKSDTSAYMVVAKNIHFPSQASSRQSPRESNNLNCPPSSTSRNTPFLASSDCKRRHRTSAKLGSRLHSEHGEVLILEAASEYTAAPVVAKLGKGPHTPKVDPLAVVRRRIQNPPQTNTTHSRLGNGAASETRLQNTWVLSAAPCNLECKAKKRLQIAYLESQVAQNHRTLY